MLIDIKQEFKRINCSARLADAMNQVISGEHPFDQDKEHFFAVGLNSDNEIKYIDLVSLGSLTLTVACPREIFRHAIVQAVDSIILCHNHPSGDCQPSDRDIKLTKRLVASGKILGIPVLDHIILENGTGNYFSIRDQLSDDSIRWKANKFDF